MNMMPPYLLKQIKERLESHKRLLPKIKTENFLPGDPAPTIYQEKIKGRVSELEWVLNIHTKKQSKRNGCNQTEIESAE